MALVAHTAVGLTVLQNGMHGLAGDELINAAVALQAVFKLHCPTRAFKRGLFSCLSCCQLKLSFSFYGMTRQQINNKLTALRA